MLFGNSEWFEELLLARMLCDRAFASKVVHVLNVGPTLDIKARRKSEFEPRHDFSSDVRSALYFSLRSYFEIYGFGTDLVVDINFIGRLLTEMADQGKLISLSEIPEAMHYFYFKIGQMDWQTSASLVDKGIYPWLERKRTAYIINQWRNSAGQDMQAVDVCVGEEKRFLRAVGNDRSRLARFSADLFLTAHDVPRISTGLKNLDARLGGGVTRGEGVLVIGSTGSGKTVIGTQTAQFWVTKENLKGLYCTTEQRHEALARRIVSNYCNVSISQTVNGFKAGSFGHKEQDKLDDLMLRMDSNMRWFDWPKGEKLSVKAGLDDYFKQAQDELGGLDFAILDWLGGAIGSDETDPDVVRRMLQIGADEMAQKAEDFNMVTMSFAQAHVDRGVNKLFVDSRSLADCKQLGRNMTSIWGLSAMLAEQNDMMDGKANYTDEQVIYVSKSRKGEGGLARVKRQMLYQRLVDNF